MKQLIFLFAVALSACNADVHVDTPISEARAVFASQRGDHAANVGITDHGVTAYYLDSDTSFSLYFSQCATLDYDGKAQQFDCAVYQTSPGTWVADFRNGEFVKINTVTGTTTIYKDGVNRVYRKPKMP